MKMLDKGERFLDEMNGIEIEVEYYDLEDYFCRTTDVSMLPGTGTVGYRWFRPSEFSYFKPLKNRRSKK